jgi:peptide/nickel transport system substrate-binding protein
MRGVLNRRGFLALAALPAMRRAAIAQRSGPTNGKSFVFVPQAMPASLDPIATPSFATRTAAMAVFETLYGTDAHLNPMPQMVEQHTMEEDGKVWTFQLRPGLLFHDGTRVTARDCVASLRRWMRKDRTGHVLGSRMDVIEALDDLRLTLKLAHPQTLVPLMLTKGQLSPPVIMPERFADTSVDTPVPQIIGSGPFRVPSLAWRAGEDLDLVRFEQYQPRAEASSFTGGGRTVLVDRVLWRAADDPVRALRDGLADWVEWLPPAAPPGLLSGSGCVVGAADQVGYYAMLRLNTQRGPMANQRIRQAVLAGVDPGAVMDAVFHADGGRFVVPIGLFAAGSEFATVVASDRIGGRQSARAIKALLKTAGYNGEPVVLLNPADDIIHTALTAALIDELTEIGLSIEERKLDRRAFEAWRHRGPSPDGNDWSAFCDSVPAGDHYDPLAISAGPPPAGGLWPGWPDDAAAGRLRDAWIDTPDPKAKRVAAAKLQDQVFATAAFVPLGQWVPNSAWRTTLTGQQAGSFPVFWDVARSG